MSYLNGEFDVLEYTPQEKLINKIMEYVAVNNLPVAVRIAIQHEIDKAITLFMVEMETTDKQIKAQK